MRVLVTGADGQLGAYVVRELRRRSYAVRGLVQPGRTAEALRGTDVEIAEGDVLDRQAVHRALGGCQAVVHAAAVVGFWPARSKHIMRVNLGGTENMIEGSLSAGIERFIYVGSASSFGPGTREKPADERSPYLNGRYHLGYMDSKMLAQRAVLEAASRRGLPAVVVNPTYLIGAYSDRNGSSGIVLRLLDGNLNIVPPGGRNFIFAGDAAVGVCNALERGQVGECYILGHANLTYREAGELFARVLRLSRSPKAAPPLAVGMVGVVGSLSAFLTRRPPILSITSTRMLCRECYYSPRKAVRELELPQSPLDTAVRAAVAWFTREGCPWQERQGVH
ncbi:MAG: NAD-dependent epimerase/dehydratase family protein [Spirochaetales bacterium]|nr:NAD-dependent epimerase/dehydratase family protein [Spirochaetales bacterium]